MPVKLPLLNTSLKNIFDDAPQQSDLYPNTTVQNPTTSTRKRKILLDIAGILAMLVLVYIFYMVLRPPTLYFDPYDKSLQYPLMTVKVPSVMVALLSLLLPLITILLLNVFLYWDKWDLYAGLVGSLLAYCLTLLVTSALWIFVGGLRPHFLTVCKPDTSLLQPGVTYYTPDICTQKGTFTQDTFHGFPSGHASTSFAGCFFLIAYLSAHLRLYRNGNIFKFFICFLPILGAMWLGLCRLADKHHTVGQVLTGVLIGVVSAAIAYKLMYVNGFLLGSGRYAHIPLMKYKNL